MPASVYVAALAGLAAVLYLAQLFLSRSRDPREPPLVHPRFPLLGHLYGVITSGTGYWGQIRIPRSQLMYTAQVFSLRVYVLNGTQLLTAVQRAARTLSFRPLGRQTVVRFSEPEQAVIDACDNERHDGYVHRIEEGMKKALAPGPGLDRMNVETAEELVRCLDALVADGQAAGEGIDLTEWVRDTITIASTRGVYGPENPYGTAEARAAFWQFEQDSPALLLGLRHLVPKGYQAMALLRRAFESYYSCGGDSRGSPLAQARAAIYRSEGWSAETKARLEFPLALAILSNSVPAAFWTLYDIYSRPELLAEIRASLTDAVTTTTTTTTADTPGAAHPQTTRHTLDLSAIKTRSRILLAAFQEMQRTRSSSASIRKVMSDTTLEHQYVLKAGAYLQLPVRPVHHDPALWGPDVAAFDPHRFVDPDAPRLKSTSLLAWGFAPHMCPGRQFATAEILMLVALVVLRFDVVPVDAAQWADEGLNVQSIASVLPPKRAKVVRFHEREEARGEWSVDVGLSSARFALVSG